MCHQYPTVKIQRIWGEGKNCLVAGETTMLGTTPVMVVAMPVGLVKKPTKFVAVLANYGDLESSTGHIMILPIEALRGHRIEECATAS